MKKNLKQHLEQYSGHVYPMHMPGHKLGRCSNLGPESLIDVTEVDGTDNLHHPRDILLEAQVKAAQLFGAQKTYFLVNGSTSGLLAAIWVTCRTGDKIILARNCHKSVHNAVLMKRLDPIYIYPSVMEGSRIAAGVNPEDIRHILEREPSVSAVVITSPNYEGMTSSICEIAKIVHEYHKLLIVDEAHGAHFSFHSYFPDSALKHGTDIVIQSTHKTLPAYTQSAMLHVNSDRVDLDSLQEALSLFQSSSPSYVLMNGLDSCRALLEEQGDGLFAKYVDVLKACRLRLQSQLKHLRLLDSNMIGKYHIDGIDPSKWVFDCSATNISGTDLDQILRNRYKIQVELDGKHHIIGMTSLCDSKEGLKAFADAIIEIDRGLKKIGTTPYNYDIIKQVQKVYKPCDAYDMGKTSLPLDKSKGKVVGEFVIPFPPGIPIIIPGERITGDILNRIKQYRDLDIDIMGMADTTCGTIRIIDEV